MSSPKQEVEFDEYRIAQTNWDQRTDEIKQGKRNWQRIALAQFVLEGFLVGGLIHIGSQAKTTVIPVLVNSETWQTQALDVQGSAPLTGDDWKKVKQEVFRNLVSNWRTVTTDDRLRKLNWDDTFTWVQGGSKAEANLHTWFATHNPNRRCLEETVSVDTDPGSPVTENTFEVWWTESVYKGGQMQTHRMQAIFTYRMTGQPVAKNNGFGILITEYTLPRGDYF